MQTSAIPATKRPYRSPTRSADASVGLDEFDTAELIAELNHRQVCGVSLGGFVLPNHQDEIGRIATLRLCGQREAAQQEANRLIDDLIDLWRAA